MLFSTLQGESEQNQKKSNGYFAAAVIGVVVLAVITWPVVIFFDRELLLLFGSEETLLPLAKRYLFPVKFVVLSFLFIQLMAAFLRNDGNPPLATKAVLLGGIFNVFGEYFFVLKLRIMGAGLATAMGSVFSFLVMLTHFMSKKNTLRFVKPVKLLSMMKSICINQYYDVRIFLFRQTFRSGNCPEYYTKPCEEFADYYDSAGNLWKCSCMAYVWYFLYKK